MEPYTARDIARFTVLKALDRRMYLSMTQLCNIMVIAWMRHHAMTGYDLFEVEGIRGWCYGFKIKEVWWDWCCSGAQLLFCSRRPEEDIASDRVVSSLIDRMLDEYGKLSNMESRDQLGYDPWLKWYMTERKEIGRTELIMLSDEYFTGKDEPRSEGSIMDRIRGLLHLGRA